MCRACDLANSRILRTDRDDAGTAHFGAPTRSSGFIPYQQLGFEALEDAFLGTRLDGAYFRNSATAFDPDGVGGKGGVAPLPSPTDLVIASTLPDDIPNNDTTTRSVTVGGPRVISTINTPDDQDWFKVELQAGVTYEIGEYATRYGPTGVPLRDAFVELFDSAGNIVAFNDSGGPDSASVDDALIIFTPEVSGTYYINARSWDTSEAGVDANPATTHGDYVGDYEVFARVSTLEPDYYNVRYETVDDPNTARDEVGLPTLDSSPLHSLDWGTRFDSSSRNPDGQEGPRPTGNEVESKIGGKNVIYFYYAREGEVFLDNAADPLNLTTTMVAKGMAQWEKNAFELALDKYEQVADIVYVPTEDRWAADIVVITYNGTPGPFTPSVLGRMSPPDTASEGQTEFNAGDGRWNQEDLAPGGFFFGTLVHELGHGHGMSHPHDHGSGRASIMRGVEEVSTANYTLGDFDLNQSVFTMMSYQDGWQTSPYGMPSSTAGYGFIGSLMAFDIAVIQDKYGVNEEWATGNDTYVLRDENAVATFDANGNLVQEATSYKSIWDAGGTDSIVYSGARDATIDLRPATLRYENGGGGWMSFAYGIHGGFTIADAVTIERAYGGSGNDTLVGNDAANLLNGGAGVDHAAGGRGDDSYFVDHYADTVIEAAGQGYDIVYASSDFVLGAGSEVEVLGTINNMATDGIDLRGNELANYIVGNAGANTLDGGGGADTLWGREGDDSYFVDGDDVVTEYVGHGYDIVYARADHVLGAGAQVEVLGTINNLATDALNLTGNEISNFVTGNAGANRIDGGGGADTLHGRGGADLFAFTTALNSGNIDTILDFGDGADRIALDDAVFAGLGLGTLSSGAFHVGAAAHDADDRIIYNSATGALMFDADGNGAGAAVQFATLNAGPILTASDFVVI
jgi:serralysin